MIKMLFQSPNVPGKINTARTRPITAPIVFIDNKTPNPFDFFEESLPDPYMITGKTIPARIAGNKITVIPVVNISLI
jgi:hypothetical protein